MSPKTCHCGRSFSKREHFERHRRTHTKEKPFACDECGRAFGRHDSLLRHARSHTRENGDCSSRSGSTASKTPIAIDFGTSQQANSETYDRDLSNTLGQILPNSGHTGASIIAHDTLNQWNDDMHQHNPAEGIIDNQYGDWTLPQQYVVDESWLLGANFDVSALDDSVSAAIASWGQPIPSSNYFGPSQSPSDMILQQLQSKADSPVPPKATSAVHIRWYTNITPSASAHPGSAAAREEQDRVDDRYRSSLSTHLRTQMTDDALPSADFLNRCISIYFSKFHPIFPIIHAPSFRPSTEKALLLLSVCSMGAVLMGTTYAAAQGRKIFQKLNKAVLSTWEKHISRGREEVLALAQSSVIGQTVAMMSGHSTDLYLAESFHGTVIAWARRAGMFKLASPIMTRERANSTTSLDTLWKDWAHSEKSRVGLALHLHDSLFSSIFHHEPLLRHDACKIPHCGSEEAYNAATAVEWFRLVTNPKPSKFEAYVSLAGILALIIETRRGNLDAAARSRFDQLLSTWRSNNQPTQEDTFCSMIMWHQACMSLRTDFDMIEILIGRDGFGAAEEVIEAVKTWYMTEGAACVAHALQVRSHVERLPAGKEPAIHVPRALFRAGIAVYAFVRMRQLSQGSELVPPASTGPPSSLINSNASDHSPLSVANVDIGDVHNIADLLRRVGHWELSRKLASILEPLLEETMHE